MSHCTIVEKRNRRNSHNDGSIGRRMVGLIQSLKRWRFRMRYGRVDTLDLVLILQVLSNRPKTVSFKGTAYAVTPVGDWRGNLEQDYYLVESRRNTTREKEEQLGSDSTRREVVGQRGRLWNLLNWLIKLSVVSEVEDFSLQKGRNNQEEKGSSSWMGGPQRPCRKRTVNDRIGLLSSLRVRQPQTWESTVRNVRGWRDTERTLEENELGGTDRREQHPRQGEKRRRNVSHR